jgi:histidinol-phosphatase (PHP family)
MATAERLYYETHSHTPLCKHANGTPSEYAERAHEQGLKGLTVTCHNPMPDDFAPHVRMEEGEFPAYLEMIAEAREEWAGRVEVLLGLECDYFPGFETYLEQQTASQPFDYILGSVHPQLEEFRERFGGRDPIAYQRNYFEQLAEAAETRLFDCLSHPDLVKNVTADYWNPERVMDDICRVLDRIADTGIAMELNTSGLKKTIREMNPFPQMLVEMRKRDIPVVVGADAHTPKRVGDRFTTAMSVLESAGYTHVSCFVRRERQDLPIRQVRSQLAATAAQGVTVG